MKGIHLFFKLDKYLPSLVLSYNVSEAGMEKSISSRNFIAFSDKRVYSSTSYDKNFVA